MPNIRRLTGATMAVAYGLDDETEIAFSGEGANFMDNCYSAEFTFETDEIDTTAFGDYPFGASEPGFITIGITLGMRNAAGAADVAFLDAMCISREPFRIAIIENRGSSTTRGWIFTVTAQSMKGGGEAKGAQDKTYTLKRASGELPPQRIVGGVAQAITFSA